MFRLVREHCVIHTLAACFANEVFPVTELVTDSVGLELADRLGWHYTNYVNALDWLVGPEHAHIWAWGKLRALQLQDKPFCHIDNDVILQKTLPSRIRNARIFAQSKDIPSYYWGAEMAERRRIAGFPDHAVAYNVGIIGGTDIAAIHRYSTEAIEAARKFGNFDPGNGTATSMMVEQYFLGAFARRERIHVEELIPIHWTDDDCKEAGYTHCVGSSKRDEYWARLAEKKLSEAFPEAYKRFLKGWQLIAPSNG